MSMLAHPTRRCPPFALLACALLVAGCAESLRGADAPTPDASPDDAPAAADRSALDADEPGDAVAAADDDAPASDAACPLAPDAGADDPLVVATDRGLLRGGRVGEARAFLGIPYAAPPVGALRWRAPEPAACWAGVRDATGYGYQCVQLDESGMPVGNEDCLTLNVWTPATPPRAPLPVLVYIHGGYNLTGSSALLRGGEHVYEGRYVAEHGPAVVVTLNYRLGALGWLAHPAFARESALGTAGNYGTLDQIAALRWVQRNARAFGGDPDRVMVFGQSAGAVNTCVLIASPLARGLFARAVMHSGPCTALARTAVEQAAAQLADRLGCAGATDVPACLRERSAPAVAAALPASYDARGGLFYNPYIDGAVLPAHPLEVIRAGRHNRVPTIVGVTANEFSTLVHSFVAAPLASDAEYVAAARRIFGATVGDAVVARYPSAAFPSPTQALVTALGDVWMACPARRTARALALGGGPDAPVRRFVFAHTFANGPLRPYGAGHTLDVLFTLHNLAYGGTVPTGSELALSDAMVGYWTRFAATGDPGDGPGAVAWPAYDPAADTYLTLDDVIAPAAGWRTAQCDDWDRWGR